MQTKLNWEQDEFHVSLERFGAPIDQRVNWKYSFSYQGKTIFEGDDLGTHQSCDADEALVALLSILALQQGDTDDDYFDSYTEDQVRFRDSDACDDLGMIAFDMEEDMNSGRTR